MNFEANRDHDLLCCGYIRNLMKQCDIYIPFLLWILIYSFYPKYDVYALGFDANISSSGDYGMEEKYNRTSI